MEINNYNEFEDGVEQSNVEKFWDSIVDTINVTTNPCIMCGETSKVEMLVHHYLEWQKGGLLDRVCPEMPKETREMLISGTHPDCWDKMFQEDEEE